jgi:hypothetical protein
MLTQAQPSRGGILTSACADTLRVLTPGPESAFRSRTEPSPHPPRFAVYNAPDLPLGNGARQLSGKAC